MMSPGHRVFAPDAEEAEVYEQMYRLYRSVYFSFGAEQVDAQALVHVLPELRRIAAQTRRKTSANERVPDDSVAATGETE